MFLLRFESNTGSNYEYNEKKRRKAHLVAVGRRKKTVENSESEATQNLKSTATSCMFLKTYFNQMLFLIELLKFENFAPKQCFHCRQLYIFIKQFEYMQFVAVC